MLWIVFALATPISLPLLICLLVLLFAVSVVGCLFGYSSCLVVWIPLFLDPSDGAFGRFDLAALCGCGTLNFCLFVCFDDEAHCLFMCEHPTIVVARDLFLAAVVPPVAALSSLRYADFWALSATGCVPLSALVKYVAVCVRVCWYCHQSGGTDVVDLPDILLPAGQYLDLFDSESETDVPSDSSDEELVEV